MGWHHAKGERAAEKFAEGKLQQLDGTCQPRQPRESGARRRPTRTRATLAAIFGVTSTALWIARSPRVTLCEPKSLALGVERERIE